MEIKKPKKPIWNNVGTRLVTALLLSAICIPPLYLGGWPWTILVSLLGARMMWEWVSMSDASPTRLAYLLPIIGLVIANAYVIQGFWLYAIFALALAALFAAIEKSRRGGLLWAGLGYLYITIPCMVIVAIRGVENGFVTDGFQKLIFIILAVVAADVGAYFGGSFFKGPKLAPKLSPNKTWSGFFSGALFGIVIGGVTAHVIGIGFVSGLFLSLPIIILSVLGDLLESGLKRVLKVKDSGTLLPGHGGLLDRLDSLMLAVIGAGAILYFMPNIWPL